ncbi:MAG: nucleotidyltransferase family protein [Chloroflexota bacterium]
MDCIVLAGGRPAADDPLYPYTQGQLKAMLDIGGHSILERVLDALQSSKYIDRILVIGLESGSEEADRLHVSRPVSFLADQGGLVSNALAGIAWMQRENPAATSLMLCSSDIPCLTGEIVDAFVDLCRPFDHAVYYPVVTQETMEARYPGSKRTFVPIRPYRVAGGDVFIVDPSIADQNHELWEALVSGRKHAWMLARAVGFGTLLKFLLRRLSVGDIEKIGLRLLSKPIKVVFSPYAELGMDIDKPNQFELLTADLARIEH